MNINKIFNDHIETIKKVEDLIPLIQDVAAKLCDTLKKGNKIFFMGNGGSAADSQHLAAELVGRFKNERMSLPAIALTTDTSALTAIANDYSFEDVFRRQIQGLAKKDDAVFGLSTSGNSKNIIKAVREAEKLGCYTVSLTGRDGGQLKDITANSIVVPSDVTARIQEAHILIGHIICEIIDEEFSG